MEESNKLIGIGGGILVLIIPSISIALVLVLILVVLLPILVFLPDNEQYEELTNKFLGYISAQYESSGDPGVISNNSGDYGGKSYGVYQFSSNMNSLAAFLNWLKSNDEDLYNRLMKAYEEDGKTYGENFDNEWVKISEEDENTFFNLQHEYTKQIYYDQVVEYFIENYDFDINSRSRALQEAVWSTSVQHGQWGAESIIEEACNLDGSDKEIIEALYKERMKVDKYFSSSDSATKKAVKERLENELEQILYLLENESDVLNGTGEMTWPTPGFKFITSPFGQRKDPITGELGKMHSGIDIRVPEGNTIIAADSGKVIVSSYLNGYGYAIYVDHGDGIETRYGHCNKLIAKVGENVERGEKIAESGNTGRSSGPHLHFEIRVNDTPVDPMEGWVD
jgi:murein DD-endopeptidase MepM/ murein hydrolase activator NlpD